MTDTMQPGLRNFDTILDQQGVSAITRTRNVVPPPVRERVTATVEPSASRGYVGKDPEQWSWSDLRDYVVAQVEERFGAFPRDSKKEYGIFKRFAEAWGARAGRIARYAFEVEGGYWLGAPISVYRFTKNSDPFFAEPISARLAEAPVQGW